MVLVLYWPKNSELKCVHWSLCSVLRFLVILLLCTWNCGCYILSPRLSPTFTFFGDCSSWLTLILSIPLNLTLSNFHFMHVLCFHSMADHMFNVSLSMIVHPLYLCFHTPEVKLSRFLSATTLIITSLLSSLFSLPDYWFQWSFDSSRHF